MHEWSLACKSQVSNWHTDALAQAWVLPLPISSCVSTAIRTRIGNFAQNLADQESNMEM